MPPPIPFTKRTTECCNRCSGTTADDRHAHHHIVALRVAKQLRQVRIRLCSGCNALTTQPGKHGVLARHTALDELTRIARTLPRSRYVKPDKPTILHISTSQLPWDRPTRD